MLTVKHKALVRSLMLGIALGTAVLPGPAASADLTIADGVVVKFGADAGLVVRDGLHAGRQVIFTSLKDDATLGQTGTQPQSAAKGDWRGVSIEASAIGNLKLDESSVRFGGAANAAALSMRKISPTIKFLSISNSTTGLRITDAAAPTLNGLSLVGNATGMEVDGGATPVVTAGQIRGNTIAGIANKTPTTVVSARGNWWGDNLGPKDAVGNPAGLGDAVSAGVDYSGWLHSAPLLNPSIRTATAAAYLETNNLQLLLSCINATEYRISENSGFTGATFQPLAGGSASVAYSVAAGDGVKNLYVQFRDAAGNTANASLSGLQLDTQAPALAVLNPSAGSFINKPITVDATASDASGISRVEFYVDGNLAATDASSPYAYAWNVDLLPEGDHTLRVVAYDNIGRTSEITRTVTIGRYIPPPDTEGPAFSNPRLAGAALAEGATVARSAIVSVDVSDRSGVARVELLLDGSLVATATGAGTYSALLALETVPNGAHTLTWRSVDSIGNASTLAIGITVTHALPPAPTLTGPANGLLTRDTAQVVTGLAQANSTVQVFLNDASAGAPAVAAGDGRFSIPVTLANGTNKIQVRASDSFGDGPLSSAITVTVDTSVPVAPANLAAASLASGKLKLTWSAAGDPNTVGYHVYRAVSAFAATGEALRINAATITATSFDDAPSPDGAYYYRVVAVNRVGTPSAPSNIVQGMADATAPKATSVVYTPLGKVDPATGRIGQGRVNVAVNLSEAVMGLPYLSVVPAGGTPIPVDLTKVTDTQYTGSFLIDATVPSGIANALFSARDMVGNRGTEITVGATLKIDTDGPTVTNIVLAPAAPIKADTNTAVVATFTLSKAMKSGEVPQLSWLLSGVSRSPVVLGGLAAIDAFTWRATVQLPSDAGSAAPENLSFTYRGIDDLDNISTKIAANNRFQVYQGSLPPLGVPGALSAKAQPGGKIQLAWAVVAEAVAYQIYRQGPADADLVAYLRTTGTTYLDQTTQDGKYRYAVASVRSQNGQEAVSGQSEIVEAAAIASPPGAPQALTLKLTGQGIVASWQPPLASQVATYNLYRAGGTSIPSVSGMAPIKAGIKTLAALDGSPNPNSSAYAVTALDTAGNESAPSESAYLNASLLPVRTLSVKQLGEAMPVVAWTAPNGNLAGYNVYLGPDATRLKLTPAPISTLTYTDTGFTGGERRYTVASVDSSGTEIGRSLSLPKISTQIASGLPIKRGIFNLLQVQVANTSSFAVDNAQVVVNIGNKDHRSAASSFGVNETRLVPVVVGGYSDLPGQAPAQIGIESVPNEGESVKTSRNTTADVTDGSLVVGMTTESFTRGGAGKVRLSVENTSEVEVELVTARGNGSNPSDEMRFKLLDVDGNVLATQPYKQAFGASVITAANGTTVARIPPGAKYVSDAFDVNVPAASPDQLRVRLEVDKLHYHTGQTDEVVIAGRGSEATVSLVDTAYVGTITDVSPVISFGDKDVVITGRALGRIDNTPVPNAKLKIIFNQQGFERSYAVTTDATGAFTYTFKPTLTDAGVFNVAAVHPDITDRPVQKSFTIDRIAVGPNPYALKVPRNYAFSIPFRATAGVGTSATNLRLVVNAASQGTGALPVGITLQPSAPVGIAERQSINVPVSFIADNTAQASGRIVFDVLVDEQPNVSIGQVVLNYTLVDALPNLVSTPSFIETGMAQGGNQLETLQVKNNGLQDALDLVFTLTKPDGSAPPSWVSIASAADGTLAIGATRNIDIAFAPSASVADGVYQFRLNVSGTNVPAQSLNVYASITQSGIGGVLFKASDIYTATVDKNGNLIQGLAGATVLLQNEDVPTVSFQLTTDSLGEALFQNVPAGNYQYRVRASNHQETAGRLQIKPGMTATQPVFLDYTLVTVSWSVTEVTLQDRYDITLTQTFETNVPAPVVVITPPNTNLPKMAAGEVFYGELVLNNYGLVRADHVVQKLPPSDPYFRYEFLAEVPDKLEAKQRVTIPYRIVALQSLDQPSGTASGGGCYSYSASYQVRYDSVCANGTTSSGGASTYWTSASSSSCTGSTSGASGGSGGSTGGFGGGGGYDFTSLKGIPPCVTCSGPETQPPCATCGGK